MIDQQFFDNPSFLEYVHSLHDLHIAIQEGWDETAEGEALRERMDDSGSHLSGDEIASLNGISADFYSLTEPSPQEVSPITAEVMSDVEKAQRARKSRHFNQALGLLRKHAERIPPSRLAYLRGSVWMEAGEYDIAAMFLQRASVLEPDNSNFRYLALHSLWKADPSTAAEHAQAILSNLGDLSSRPGPQSCRYSRSSTPNSARGLPATGAGFPRSDPSPGSHFPTGDLG